MIGKSLGHYRIFEKLGAGGMGVVYRARDEQLERDVALKVLPAGVLRDASVRRQFRKEALLLAKLNHPNIETVYEFDTENGTDFLVMEYVPGNTLAHKLANGSLPEKEVIVLGMQIAAALEDAHERGIVHRDLKPANIALTEKGQAKVLDFGLAKLLSPVSPASLETLTDTQQAAGTLPYMSPEQLRGEPVDARTDIYSAGAVLYEMATHRKPFDEDLPSQLIDAILHQPPVPPRALSRRTSPELERIILKCLDKEPQNRYQSAKELSVDLQRLGGLAARTIASSRVKSGWPRTRIAYAAAGLVVVAVTVVAWRAGGLRQRFMGTPALPVHSLAVLPLENRSGDPDQEYFADGVMEALIADLGQIAELRVISRTSMMHYKGTKKTLPEIARELDVDAAVEGSVQRVGNQVQINARLIHAPSDRHLWSASYERDLRDILPLQGEVASAIARGIQIKLTAKEKARLNITHEVNPEAHEAFLRGRYHWNKGGQDQRERAKGYFEQSIALDSNYAPAYAGLADYYWATNLLAPAVSIPKAKNLVIKALSLDNNQARAHTSLAAIRFLGDWDFPSAEREFQNALALNPSDPESHQLYSVFLSSMERRDEALTEIRRAQQLDPLSLLINVTAGWTFYFAGRYAQAIEQCRKALDLEPNSVGSHDCLGQSLRAEGKYQEALTESQLAANLSHNDPGRVSGLAIVYAAAGKRAEAVKILQALRKQGQQSYLSSYFIAAIYSSLNRREPAFAALEHALEMHDPYLTSLKMDKAFENLRSDPRFTNLTGRIGFPQ